MVELTDDCLEEIVSAFCSTAALKHFLLVSFTMFLCCVRKSEEMLNANANTYNNLIAITACYQLNWSRNINCLDVLKMFKKQTQNQMNRK